MNDTLPISDAIAKRCSKWLYNNYGVIIDDALAGSGFGFKDSAAIFCQETAYIVHEWLDKFAPNDVLKLCVFDASGDAINTKRFAFPKNKISFERKYSSTKFIAASNAMRAARGMKPSSLLYKGYGIFQYDLQHILTDEVFFLQQQWSSMTACVSRLKKELIAKKKIAKENKWLTYKLYNGGGIAAEKYANNVMHYYSIV